MADQTEIAWADSTFNPWIGCTKVGPGCDHCYAEADFDLRKHRAKWGPGNPRSRTSAANWKKPLRWNENACWFAQCDECGWRGESIGGVCASCHGTDLSEARRRVFCASLADVFDNEVDVEWRADLFALINATPNLDWLLLTKRIGNVPAMVSIIPGWIPKNVWLGATICNQAEAYRDIPKLLAVPAHVRFLSMEPLLGPVSLNLAWPCDRNCSEYQNAECPGSRGLCAMQNSIDWVVVGGESGTNARPMHPDWVRSIRHQCAAADVPFMFKQWGEWAPYDRGLAPSSELATPGSLDTPMMPVGKKVAGRMLDGVQHDGYPT